MHDYSKFKDVVPVGDNMLARLAGLAEQTLIAEADVERLTEELKTAQAKLRNLQEIELPQLMDEAGMAEFKTKDGIEINVKEIIRASIPKAKAPLAFKWLRENGHEALIKNQVVAEFGRGEDEKAQELLADLTTKGRSASSKKTVHPQTLQAFIKEQLAEGVAVPLDLFGAVQVRQAKIKLETEK